MKLFVHIGAHKTASTLLQNKFAEYAAEFAREGIFYSGKIGRALAYSMLNNNEPERKEAAFINWAGKKQGRYIIVSFEGLLGHSGTMYDNTDEMANKIYALSKKLNMEVEILAFVRRQDTWIESMYHQMIKQGDTYSFDKYLRTIKLLCLDWYIMIDQWHLKFENIHIFPYEALADNPNKMWAEIMNMIGSGVMPADFPVINPSLNNEGLKMCLQGRYHIKNEKGINWKRRNKLQADYSKDIKKPFGLFDKRSRKNLLEYYGGSNVRLFNNFIHPAYKSYLNQYISEGMKGI